MRKFLTYVTDLFEEDRPNMQGNINKNEGPKYL